MRRARAASRIDGSDVLRHATVSPATLENYKNAVHHFEAFVTRRRWSLQPQSLCRTMERFFWHHANLGFSSAIGRHTLYGWLHLRCPNKSVESNQLANAREAINGWRKLNGDDSRDPLPEEIYLSAAHRLVMTRKPLTAAATFCQAQLYLRPSELLCLRPEDVLLPVRGAHRYKSTGVVIAPRELGRTTKARSHDDTILADRQCHEALASVLAELVRIRSSEERLFPLTLNCYEKRLRDVGSAMGLPVDFVPHTLRHCGPANDLFFERRDMAAVAKRGRWASLKSVQRYGKSGRLIKIWRQIAESDRVLWTARASNFGAVLLAALRRLPIGYCGS